MPPKKCIHKVPKAELVFLERPREGPVHCYETPLLSAKNPRLIPTKPADQNTSADWVRPQFETTKSVVLRGHQKHHCGPHETQDSSHSFLHAGGACQKAVACKFLPLTFENAEGFAVHQSNHLNCSRKNSQSNKRTAAKANIQVHSQDACREILSLPQPVEPEVFSPPGTEIPEVPSIRNHQCSSTLPKRSSHIWHPEKELAVGIDPCGKGESAAVLVEDTPEHEYGVKVTWRQRPHLMKYLQERGKLSAVDVLVKANLSISRKQAKI